MEHRRLDEVEPHIRQITSNPELHADSKAWHESRQDFINRLEERDETTIQQGWQRHYMKGEAPSGVTGEDHLTRRRLKPPRRK